MKRTSCVYCGHVTRAVCPIYDDQGEKRRRVGSVRECYGCGRRFDHYDYAQAEPEPEQEEEEKRACTLGASCAESASCDKRHDAMRCPVYRAVVVRKMRVAE